MICPLCRYTFVEKNACHGCGVVKNCSLIRCPSCGYEFAESSRIVSLLTRLRGWLKKRRKERLKHGASSP